KFTDHSHLSNPTQLEIRHVREKMRERAENELLPLQEIRKALLTDEALAVLPSVTDINHNLIHNRQKMNPHLPQSSFFYS
ncbi:unnamed protein product, partial [Rotaria sp. Silwood2]